MHIRRQARVDEGIFRVSDYTLLALAVFTMLACALELRPFEIWLFRFAGFVAAWTIAEQVIFWDEPDDLLGPPLGLIMMINKCCSCSFYIGLLVQAWPLHTTKPTTEEFEGMTTFVKQLLRLVTAAYGAERRHWGVAELERG